MATSLTLNEALRSNRLADFIAQAEAEGVAAADEAEFSDAMKRLVKAPRPVGRTSRSRGGGSSTGK